MTPADVLLREQWVALRRWIEHGGLVDRLVLPSVLPGWSIGDLVAHLGRSFAAVEATRPATSGTLPMTLGEYVSAYADASAEIAEGTRVLAADFGDDLLAGVDACADRGLAALLRLSGEVVLAPRGPILRDDFVMTRLLELVVHADDLALSAPGIDPPPLLDAAVHAVAVALRDVYAERVGEPPAPQADREWIRSATGRSAHADPRLPLL